MAPLVDTVVPAAVIVLWRDSPRGREVVLVRRGRNLSFAGGWHAFPGGRVDPADGEVAVSGLGPPGAALVACAVRETLEETGVLLVPGADRIPPEALRATRRRLLDGSLTLPRLLAEHGLRVDPGLLVPAGRWITPDFLPLRWDARIFLAEVGPDTAVDIWPGELADGGFVLAADALDRWRRGEALLHPPQLHALRLLARQDPIDLAALRAPPYCDGFVPRRMEFQEGVFLAALRTPTLPPATHTNSWLVPDGAGGLAVIDPGSGDPGEQARLLALLEEHAAEGLPPRAIWLTHAHPDHVGAVSAVVERWRIPVRAHPLAAGRGPFAVEPLADGELLGRFRVLATPGHAREHVVFLDEGTGALLCGDMVSTLSTIQIDPPEGDMAEYVRQLSRLASLGPRTLFPAHGPPVPEAASRLLAAVAHRRAREELVLAALAEPGTLEAVTARAYADTPPALHPVAARSCLASLLKLRAEGRAEERDGVWQGAR